MSSLFLAVLSFSVTCVRHGRSIKFHSSSVYPHLLLPWNLLFIQKYQKNAGFLLCRAKDCFITVINIPVHRGKAVTGALYCCPHFQLSQTGAIDHRTTRVHKSDIVEHRPTELSKLHLRKAQKELIASPRNIHNFAVFRCIDMRKSSLAMKYSNSMSMVLLKVPSW